MINVLGKRVKVKKAVASTGFKMQIEFEDGLEKEIDLEKFLRGPIFEPLRKNQRLFRNVRIEGGTITWSNGADIDPDVLYYDLMPAWMEEPETL
ncbi:hypothetical protein MNBD_CHLOROFLEXI01-2335 [hydrothermal vent metagenome]|uniref:DUF2442 domain-containing protein n=1 Tax=hydrothermal vent metagenome TaxID=652676 RepID=A0A3B0VRJ0_9ZZZZ